MFLKPFHKLKDLLSQLFKDARIRRFGLSLFFGLLVVITYYLLAYFIPLDIELHNEIVTVLFILISVLILFPAREAILLRILPKYDYLIYFGYDPHHLELLARHFSVDELKQKIFQEFMDWLGTKSAMMAILDPARDHFNYYIYTKGEPTKEIVNIENSYIPESILKYIKNKKGSIDAFEDHLDSNLRIEMNKLQAVSIHPFIFRKSLTGYLVFYSQPRHPHTNRALEFFCHMAAVAIQNYILSLRVIDAQEYDLELKSAKRIQKLFSKTYVPAIKGFNIEPRGSIRTVLEFFKTGVGSFFMVALSADRLTGASGIILYGMLGSLHALLHREPGITINKLLNHMRNDSELSKYEYNIDILIMEIMANEPQVTILHEGDHYSFFGMDDPKKNLLSLGWRNLIELDRKRSYFLSYHSMPLLSIEHTKEQNRLLIKSEESP